MIDPIAPFLAHRGVLVLDGGLATELENRGEDLVDPLWSAKALLENPTVIREVHLDYLRSGADCVTSASYQATFEGLERRGLSHAEAAGLLRRSVELAIEARDLFWRETAAGGDRLRPLVAASVGPYGAFLADGSEYSGDYGLGVEALAAFHRERFDLLSTAGADLVACETIPSRLEALALMRLLDGKAGTVGWMSFSCRDAECLSDGTPLRRMLEEIEGSRSIVAVGVNCTPPEHISGLLESVRGVTSKPLVVYPNSGETWDALGKEWDDAPTAGGLAEEAVEWLRLGAVILGGCCRTGPDDIRALRAVCLEGRR